MPSSSGLLAVHEIEILPPQPLKQSCLDSGCHIYLDDSAQRLCEYRKTGADLAKSVLVEKTVPNARRSRMYKSRIR